MLALFFPQSKHWVVKEHLLFTEIEPFGRKEITTFSPHDRRFRLLEAIIESGNSCLIDQDIAFSVDLTAARKSELFSLWE
jgi:hypothetical protein